MNWDSPDDLDRSLAEMDPVEAGAYADAIRQSQLLDQLVALRKRRSLSQKAIAEGMETTQSAVSELENGHVEPRLSTLQRYVRALGGELDLRLVEHPTQVAALPGSEPALVDDVLPAAVDQSLGAVLEVLLRGMRGQITRSADQLVEGTGLTESAVGKSVDRLSEKGWVKVLEAPGRLEPVVVLNHDRALVVGVSLHERYAHGTITDLRVGKPLADRRCDLPSADPNSVVAAVAELVTSLVGEAGAGREVIGLGVELAGVVRNGLGVVSFARDFDADDPLWHNFALQAELQAATGLPTVVENDTNALAVHEYLSRGDPSDLAVVLFSENGGIGCGLVRDGDLLHGASGISGEIGHVVVEPDGRPCRHTHQRGCLETVAGITAIDERIAGRKLRRSGLDVYRTAGEHLGDVLTTMTSVLASPLIVVCGPERLTDERTQPARVFGSAVKERLDRGWFTNFDVKPTVELRVLDETAGPRGAASVAVRHFLRQPLHWLSTATESALSVPDM